jgi:hypothetical protein
MLVVVALGSVSLSAGASQTVTRPGPPTDVQATYVPGVPGVSVSWSAPVSDGGSPILYYFAFPLFGKTHSSGGQGCTSNNPGPNTCHIAGLKVGKVTREIRVRAVSAKGRGHVAIVFPVAIPGSPASGGASPSPASGTGQPSTGPVSPGVGSDTAASNTTSDTPASDVPAELPFTGMNLATLLTLGGGLVLVGWLILDPFRRRRVRFRRVSLHVLIGS